jgi:FkbM family methyltransferase
MLSLFETAVEPGMVVLDIGAFLGYYTLVAAHRVGPSGKVFAFEPTPATTRSYGKTSRPTASLTAS